MEILTTTGFSTNGYGKWMNKIMESSPSEWVLFYDHDIFLANSRWFRILQQAIKDKPECGLFTCITNRIGNPQQRIKVPDTDDILEHIRLADRFEDERKQYVEAIRPTSGIMMLTSKTAWGNTKGFKTTGIYGVDTEYYGQIIRANYKVYIINNLYVYHRYRKQV